MAFMNGIGNVLKQAANTHSTSSLYQAIRCMSSARLFVGGLSYGTCEMSLKEAFSPYGQVIEAQVIIDRDTGKSRGFGFVSYESNEEASKAMQSMDGQDLDGRRIRVNNATERARGGFGGGYGGRGGYGGGGGDGDGDNFFGGGGRMSS